MSKILVTGASGFIGKRLLEMLKQHNDNEVVESTIDVSDARAWEALPACDTVIHLAAMTFVPASWENPVSFFQTNAAGTLHACEYCRKQKARLIVTSAYLYGIPSSLPIAEDAPIHPNNPYAFSKKTAEDICGFYNEFYKVPIVIVRPFNIYGYGQKDMFLIPSIIKQLKAGGAIYIKDKTPRRDYIYVDDVVAMMLQLLNKPVSFNIFNIGSGESHSPEDIIGLMQEIAGTDLPVFSEDVVRQNEIPDTIADMSKAKELLNWEPSFTIRKGLEDYLSKENMFAKPQNDR